MTILFYLRRTFQGLQSLVGGKVYLAGFMLFHWVLVLFAVSLIADAIYPPAHAQSGIQDLARRVSVLEALDVSAQLAGIHQELHDMHEEGKRRDSDWKPIGTAAAAGMLVIERAVRAMAGKAKERDAV